MTLLSCCVHQGDEKYIFLCEFRPPTIGQHVSCLWGGGHLYRGFRPNNVNVAKWHHTPYIIARLEKYLRRTIFTHIRAERASNSPRLRHNTFQPGRELYLHILWCLKKALYDDGTRPFFLLSIQFFQYFTVYSTSICVITLWEVHYNTEDYSVIFMWPSCGNNSDI